MKLSQRRPLHRAWPVFIGLCVYYFVAFGLLFSGFGLFLPSMSADLGIPYVQLSVTNTVRVLAGMLTTALMGRVFPRVRLRRFLSVILLLLVGTLVLVSLSSRLWQMLPVFAVMGLCCGFSIYGIVPVILNQWFTAPAPLITAASACGAAGGIVLCPLLSQVISRFGWRIGYRAMGLMVLAIMLPIAAVLLDYTPADRKLAPLDRGGQSAPAAAPSAGAERPLSPALAGLLTGFFLVAALAGGMYVHISSALLSRGFSQGQASVLVCLFQAGTALFQFVPGLLCGRFSLRAILTVSLPLVGLGAAAMVFLNVGSPLPAVILVVFILGGSRMFPSVDPLLARHAVGQRQFTAVYARLQSVYLVGTALTSILYGGIYSATGSYDASLWLIAGCMAALLILTQVIFTLTKPTSTANGGNQNVQ